MRRLLQPARPDALALVLLVLAAIGVLVAGVQHGRLFHRGYAEVEFVGPLFLMDAIGSMVVVLALVVDRVWLFCLGAVSICLPALASIAISHSSVGFLGFREGGYDLDARVIVAAETGAVVFALIGVAVAIRGRPRGGDAAVLARAPLAAVIVVVIGCAIVGIGVGSAPAAGAPAPHDAAVAASRQRIAAAGASARLGRELFADQGCDRCHALAAIGAGGVLGPRLDALDEDLDDNLESIEEPRNAIADGYPEELMPTDFDERLDAGELRALAAIVTAASGGEQDGRGDAGNRGRGGSGGRGRGREGGGDG